MMSQTANGLHNTTLPATGTGPAGAHGSSRPSSSLWRQVVTQPEMRDMVMRKIIRIQAWWRGVRTRKWFRLWMNHSRGSEFDDELAWAEHEHLRVDIAEARSLQINHQIAAFEEQARRALMQQEYEQRMDLNKSLNVLLNWFTSNYPVAQFLHWETADRKLIAFRAQADLINILAYQESVAREWLVGREELFRGNLSRAIAAAWEDLLILLPNEELKVRAALVRTEHEERQIIKSICDMGNQYLAAKFRLTQWEALEEEARQDIITAERAAIDRERQASRRGLAPVFEADRQRFMVTETQARADVEVEYFDDLIVLFEALHYVSNANVQNSERKIRRCFVTEYKIVLDEWKERPLIRAEENEEFNVMIKPMNELNKLMNGCLVLTNEYLISLKKLRQLEDQDRARIALLAVENVETISRKAVVGNAEAQDRQALELSRNANFRLVPYFESQHASRKVILQAEQTAFQRLSGLHLIRCAEDASRVPLIYEEEATREQMEFTFDNQLLVIMEHWARDKLAATAADGMIKQYLAVTLAAEPVRRNAILGEEKQHWSNFWDDTAKERARLHELVRPIWARLAQETDQYIKEMEPKNRQAIVQENEQIRTALDKWREAQRKERELVEASEYANRTQEIEKPEALIFGWFSVVHAFQKEENKHRRTIRAEENNSFWNFYFPSQAFGIGAVETSERTPILNLEKGDWELLIDQHIVEKKAAGVAFLMRKQREAHEEEQRNVLDAENKFRTEIIATQWQEYFQIETTQCMSEERIMRAELDRWEVRETLNVHEFEQTQRAHVLEREAAARQRKLAEEQDRAIRKAHQTAMEKMQFRFRDERLALQQTESQLRTQWATDALHGFHRLRTEAVMDVEDRRRRAMRRDEANEWNAMFARWMVLDTAMGNARKVTFQFGQGHDRLRVEMEEDVARRRARFIERRDRNLLVQMRELFGREISSRQDKISLFYRRLGELRRGIAELFYDRERRAVEVEEEKARIKNVLKVEERAFKGVLNLHALHWLECQELAVRDRISNSSEIVRTTLMLEAHQDEEPLVRAEIEDLRAEELAIFQMDHEAELTQILHWLQKRTLQAVEARERRLVLESEVQIRQILSDALASSLDRIAREEAALAERLKDQAVRRLHVELVERDSRKMLLKDELRHWQNIEAGLDELAEKHAREQAAIAAREEKIRQEAELRAAREAERLRLEQETREREIERSLNQIPIVVRRRSENSAAMSPQEQSSAAGSRASSGLVSRKRDEWAHTSTTGVTGYRPSAYATDVMASPMPIGASGSPFAATAFDDDSAGLNKTKVGLRAPINEPRQYIRLLDSIYGHSCASVYNYYCNEYGIRVHPVVQQALPRQPGFPIKELRMGSSQGVPAEGWTIVEINGVVPGNRGILPLLEMVRLNPGLHTLILRDCGLQSTSIEWIVEALIDHPSVTTLDVSDNKISAAGVACLLHLARKNPRVVTITMDGTYADVRQQQALAQALHLNRSSRGNTVRPLVSAGAI